MSLLKDLPALRDMVREYVALRKLKFMPTPELERMKYLAEKIGCDAPAMLEVLALIHAGDALALKSLKVLLKAAKFDLQRDQWNRLDRLQKAAERMEADGDGL